MLRGRYGAENVPGSALMFRQIGPNGLGHLGIVRIKAGQHGGGGVILAAAQSVGDGGAGLAQPGQAQVEAHALQGVDGAEGLGQVARIQELVAVSKSPPQQA